MFRHQHLYLTKHRRGHLCFILFFIFKFLVLTNPIYGQKSGGNAQQSIVLITHFQTYKGKGTSKIFGTGEF
jgi:hypothetical protein